MFLLGGVMVAIAYKNNVINIYYQVDTSSTRMTIKDLMICLTSSHTTLLNNVAKLSKRLF